MNRFVKSVAVLVSGTAMAQAIGYLVAPVLTRLYSPEEMGELGIYMRAVGFIAAVATLRFELALPLPKRDDHSFVIYRMTLRIALAMLLVLGIAGAAGLLWVPEQRVKGFFLAITLVSAFFLVFTNLGINWAIRTGAYRKISTSKVVNALGANGFRLLFGFAGWGAKGLLGATLIGYGLAALPFVKQAMALFTTYGNQKQPHRERVLTRKHREFPLINLPHTAVDLGRELIIGLLIVQLFNEAVFGSYNHAFTMLRLPVALVGASIGQVLFNRCAELLNQKQTIHVLVARTMLILFGLSVPAFTLVFLYGEPVFTFVFGDQWTDSGLYAETMALWLLLAFISSSLSTLPLVLNYQKRFFFMSLIGTSIQLIGFGVLPLYGGEFFDQFINVLQVVTLAQSGYLVVLIAVLYRMSKFPRALR
ncbi:MAG: lipopolysaccharide biosynthesis protein [Flavobacteriales bacterium]|jgi:O-antigen/teichoic acid export membrane protein